MWYPRFKNADLCLFISKHVTYVPREETRCFKGTFPSGGPGGSIKLLGFMGKDDEIVGKVPADSEGAWECMKCDPGMFWGLNRHGSLSFGHFGFFEVKVDEAAEELAKRQSSPAE